MRLAGSVSDRGRCGGSWLASGSVERRHRCAAHANLRAPSPSRPTHGRCSWSSRSWWWPCWRCYLGCAGADGWRLRRSGSWPASPVTVHRLDHLPGVPAIVVANHPSWLDGLALATVLPHSFRFIAGEVLQHEGLTGFVLKRLGTEFVERYEREHGAADTDRVVAVIRAGHSLVLFPEGRLARAPGLRPFHMGAFVAAAQAAAPVVPVAIRGTRTILRPEHHFPRKGAVNITVGQPISPMGTDWAAAVVLQHAARDAIPHLSGEPDVE